MNSTKVEHMIYVSLDPGDFINQSLTQVAIQNNLKSGWINGIGAIHNIELGFYNLDTKSYSRKYFTDDFELTSLIGNISIKENNPFIHSHITFSDKFYKLSAGHLFDAQISAAGEFIIFTSPNSIVRKMNNQIGLPLWCLRNNEKSN